MLRELQLYVYPRALHYGAKEATAFLEHLQVTQTHTQLVELYSPQLLQLQENAAVFGGYRYSAQAFEQAAQIIAPGLGRLACDLSGTTRRSHDALYDAQLAIRTFNAALGMRFAVLERYFLLRNAQSKLLYGLVSERGVGLDNAAIFKKVHTAFTDGGNVFVGARVVGRAVAVWYRQPKSVMQILTGSKSLPVYEGFYFCNGEQLNTIARLYRAVYLPFGVLLGEGKEFFRKIKHNTVDFEGDLDWALADVLQTKPPTQEIGNVVARCARTSLLGEHATMRDAKQLSQRLRAHLADFNIASGVATAAVARAVYGSTGLDNYNSEDAYLDAMRQRNWLDVVVGVLQEAREFLFSKRERLEQSMFDFLVNNEGF